MNITLFYSSLYFTFIHYFFLNFKPINNIYYINNINYYITLGLISSILNHGLTNNFFVYFDRIIMIINFFVMNYSIIKTFYKLNHYKLLICYILLYLSTYLYYYSKNIIKYNKINKINNNYHLLSHLFISINNIIILLTYNKIN